MLKTIISLTILVGFLALGLFFGDIFLILLQLKGTLLLLFGIFMSKQAIFSLFLALTWTIVTSLFSHI